MNCKKCGYLLTENNITCPQCGDINENYGKSNVQNEPTPVPFAESTSTVEEPITPVEPIQPAINEVPTPEPVVSEAPVQEPTPTPEPVINETQVVQPEVNQPVPEPVINNNNINGPVAPVITNEPITSSIPKKKSKAGLVVLLVLLIAAVLGVGGYFGYKYFFGEKPEEPAPVEKHENNLLFVDKMTDKEVFDMMYNTLAITYEDGITTTELEKTLPTYKKNIPSKLTVNEKGVLYTYAEQYKDADKRDFVEEIGFQGTTATDANSVTTITNLTGGGIIKVTEFILKMYDYDRGLQLFNYIKEEYTKMYPEESGNTLNYYELRGDLTFTSNGIDNHQIQLCYDKNEDGSYKLWILETDWKD